MTTRYEQIFDGDWIAPVRRGFRIKCCDCGLVHEMDFRIRGDRIEVRHRRLRGGAARRTPKGVRAARVP